MASNRMIFRILFLIFGIIGGIYTVLGGAFLFFGEQFSADIPAMTIIGVVFFSLGIVFLLVSLLFLLLRKKRQASIEELRTYGLQATGSITEIVDNHHLTYNNQPYRYALVTCLHPVTRKETILKSDSFPSITRAIGDPVNVYFDNYDAKRYWVALEDNAK